MASCTRTPCDANADWQSILAESVRNPFTLCHLLGLPPELAVEAEASAGGFTTLVPRPYLARIHPGDPTDPLLLQVLPRAAEKATPPGYGLDPVGEFNAQCGPGLLRKYQGRLLMVTTGACAVHCRFCFRRHFPYEGRPGSTPDWDAAVHKIAADNSIREVILSGGDPLALPDSDLARLAGRLAGISHVRRLRVHSRMPVMVPQRVNDDLISWLRGGPLLPLMVVHVNHPAEIDGAVAEAFGRLVDAGIPLLSQTVLLRAVNDQADVLVELFQRLIDLRVMPYYLHHLDPVVGAAHFEVPIATGLALMSELRNRLPGYATPRYVRETPGGTSKEVLA